MEWDSGVFSECPADERSRISKTCFIRSFSLQAGIPQPWIFNPDPGISCVVMVADGRYRPDRGQGPVAGP